MISYGGSQGARGISGWQDDAQTLLTQANNSNVLVGNTATQADTARSEACGDRPRLSNRARQSIDCVVAFFRSYGAVGRANPGHARLA